MQTCEKCHVKIRGNKEACPLCGSELVGEPQDPAFPVIPPRRYTSRMILKIALFAFCVLIIVMGTIRYLVGPEAAWTSAVMLWAPLGLAGLVITMAYRYNVLKLLTAEAYTAMILNLLIDRETGWHGWAIGFVVPSLFLALTIVVFALGLILKMKISEFLVYLLLNEVVAFFQIIFLVKGTNPYPAFAVITLAAMLIFIAAEMIFLYQDFRNATAKTLHL